MQSFSEVFRLTAVHSPPDAALCRVSRQQKARPCVCVCGRASGFVMGGGLRAEERRRGSVGGGDIKDEGKSDPLVRTKQAVGFRDKGNAIYRVTVNATHASPVWLHSAFHSFNFIRPRFHNKHRDPTETVLFILNSMLRFVFRMFCKFLSDVLLCGYVCLGRLGQELCFQLFVFFVFSCLQETARSLSPDLEERLHL